MPESQPLKRTPLYENHRRAGAKLVEFAGWEMPVQYSGLMDEHRAVRTAAGLFDVSHMGQVRVGGRGAEAYLQRLTPNDVSKLAPGRAHYSGLLDESGHYLDDILVYRLGAEDFLVVVNASNADADFAWMKSHAPADAALADVSDDWALLALQGPRASAILARLSPDDLPAIKYYRFAEGTVLGKPAILSRTGYTGEDGFELYVTPQDAAAIWDALLDAGKADGLVPAGLGARDTLRLEAGMALYGHELDATTSPWEAGLDWVVKMDKGDFIGRAALEREHHERPRRRLIGFEVTGRGIARQGHGILRDGERVGAVTSGTYSPTFEKALGMGYAPAALCEVGTPIEIDVRGKAVEARIAPLPFYKRAK
jgi:glycine cleavage system T protein (aminomethyltransferase)